MNQTVYYLCIYKVHKLERSLLIKQVMIDAFSTKCEELKKELTSVRSSSGFTAPHSAGRVLNERTKESSHVSFKVKSEFN